MLPQLSDWSRRRLYVEDASTMRFNRATIYDLHGREIAVGCAMMRRGTTLANIQPCRSMYIIFAIRVDLRGRQ